MITLSTLVRSKHVLRKWKIIFIRICKQNINFIHKQTCGTHGSFTWLCKLGSCCKSNHREFLSKVERDPCARGRWFCRYRRWSEPNLFAAAQVRWFARSRVAASSQIHFARTARFRSMKRQKLPRRSDGFGRPRWPFGMKHIEIAESFVKVLDYLHLVESGWDVYRVWVGNTAQHATLNLIAKALVRSMLAFELNFRILCYLITLWK